MKTFKPVKDISYVGGWVMKTDITKLISSLDSKEINVLLKLYYYQDGIIKGSNDFKKDTLDSLTDKNLIFVNIKSKVNIVGLTDYGLSVCGSVMYNRVNENSKKYKEKIKLLPERAAACFVNRILWKDVFEKENGRIDPITEPYAFEENLWYERVLLKDARIINALEQFYNVLEELGFIENINGQRWCSSEVENFLKSEYKKIMDLSWAEEDSLKYYFFFYMYAQEQKNLINFSGGGEEYRSMFYRNDTNPRSYLNSSKITDPFTLLSSLGLSEKRVIGFLEEMQNKDIVGVRYYPLSSSSFFSEDDKIFVIKNIKSYMDYIKKQFLTPIVDSLLG